MGRTGIVGGVGLGALAVVCCAALPAVLAFLGGATLTGLLGGGLLLVVLTGAGAALLFRGRRGRARNTRIPEA